MPPSAARLDAQTLGGAAAPNLLALPDALLVDILSRLQLDERLRAQLVCKRLCALIASPAAGPLWRRLSFEGACACALLACASHAAAVQRSRCLLTDVASTARAGLQAFRSAVLSRTPHSHAASPSRGRRCVFWTCRRRHAGSSPVPAC